MFHDIGTTHNIALLQLAEVLLCSLTKNTASNYLYWTALLPISPLTAMLSRWWICCL